MWFTATIGSNNRPLLTTYKLFDNQRDAEQHANNCKNAHYILCCYFPKSGETYSKKWEYVVNNLVRVNNIWTAIPNNNANFTP